MNIEAYNLDSLRRLVRSLQDENKKLKARLNKANIAYGPEYVFERSGDMFKLLEKPGLGLDISF